MKSVQSTEAENHNPKKRKKPSKWTDTQNDRLKASYLGHGYNLELIHLDLPEKDVECIRSKLNQPPMKLWRQQMDKKFAQTEVDDAAESPDVDYTPTERQTIDLSSSSSDEDPDDYHPEKDEHQLQAQRQVQPVVHVGSMEPHHYLETASHVILLWWQSPHRRLHATVCHYNYIFLCF